MNQKFTHFIQPWKHHPVAVAVSGGADSMALMHLLHQAGVPIVVLHVNHGLRPTAQRDAALVQRTAARLGVDCHILYWRGDKPSSGVEDAARDARYALLTGWCRDHHIHTLMVAHHSDDQIETFLMNLARGSGIYGLAAMRPIMQRDGIEVVRPLLEMRRDDLRRYCQDNDIAFVHDEMNDDERYTRVRMRHHRHVLQDALDISDARILLAIKNLGRTRDALDAGINQRLENAIENNRAVFNAFFLFDEAMEIRLKLLGNLLQRIGGKTYPPRLKSLERALDKLTGDTQFTLAGCVLRRRGNQILIAREGSRTSFKVRKENEKTKHTKET